MSFGYLPTSVFLIVTLSFSILLITYAINIFKEESKFQSIGFLSFGISGLCTALIKIFKEYFRYYEHLVGVLLWILSVFLITGYILISVAAWHKTKGDQQKRKNLIIILTLIILAILAAGIVIALPA